MSPSESVKEIARLLLFDVSRHGGDHHDSKSSHPHCRPDALSCGPESQLHALRLRVAPLSSVPSQSQKVSFALQRDDHCSQGGFLKQSGDTSGKADRRTLPLTTRHTLLWRLSFAFAARKHGHVQGHARDYCKNSSHHGVSEPFIATSGPATHTQSPPPTKPLPARHLSEPTYSTLLTHWSPEMCKWNPNSKHPILSRRCSHWDGHHESLPVDGRPVPAIWCNKCWSLCAFESNEPIHSPWVAWFFYPYTVYERNKLKLKQPGPVYVDDADSQQSSLQDSSSVDDYYDSTSSTESPQSVYNEVKKGPQVIYGHRSKE